MEHLSAIAPSWHSATGVPLLMSVSSPGTQACRLSPHPKDIPSGPCLAIFSKGGSLEINVVRISSKREREKKRTRKKL